MPSSRQDIFDILRDTPGFPVIKRPTEVLSDLIVAINVQINRDSYEPLPLETPKEDNDVTGLELFLVYESPVQGTAEKCFVTRIYANERVRQDTYNWTIRYAGASADHPTFIRRYLIPKSQFVPTARGTRPSGITYCRITNQGTGYTSAPTVSFSGGAGTGAAATAIVGADGKLYAIVITNEGSGYTSAPTISFTGGGGSGAAATAVIQPVGCTLIDEMIEEISDPEIAKVFISVTRIFETLPGPNIPSRAMTADAMGEVVETVTRDVAADAATPSLDYLTTGYHRAPVNSVKSTEQISTAPSYPTRISYEYDRRTEAYVEIRKRFVDGATVSPPTSVGLETTEYQADPTNKYRSIEIVKRVPSDVVGKTIVHSLTATHSFPNTIIGLEWVYAYNTVAIATASGGGSFLCAFDIVPRLFVKHGYSGIVEARLRETFTTNPEETLPPLSQFLEVGGNFGYAFAYRGVTDSGRYFANSNAAVLEIPPSLHDVLTLPAAPDIRNTFVPFTGSPSSTQAVAIAPSGRNGDIATIPASTPTALPYGQWIVKDVAKEKWTGNIWVKSVLEILVPPDTGEAEGSLAVIPTP